MVQDIFLTETTYLADVVLPASAFPEKTEPSQIQMKSSISEKAINPPGEAKQDLWIIQELAKELVLIGITTDQTKFMKSSEIAWTNEKYIWERLVREGAVTYPCDSDDKPGNEVIFGEGFPTKNKKGKLVSARLYHPMKRLIEISHLF